MVASARAQKPVGSAPWIAAEKENIAELVEQEMEEVEYPVRHEMDWLNEHMTEIFSKGQANFADVFKTPGKMRGKTPRTARKRNPEESRVPLSEIFSSAQKQLENQASTSPFIHRVVSKPAPVEASHVPRTKIVKEEASQPECPDLTQNLNSSPKHNSDSGYHGMPGDDEMVLPVVQQESQASTQPFEQDEPMNPDIQEVNFLASQQTNEESFHSAREEIRARGETVEPNKDPTPTQERKACPIASVPKESDTGVISTPIKKRKSTLDAKMLENRQKKEPEPKKSVPAVSKPEPSPEKAPVSPVAAPIQTQESHPEDEDMENVTKDDTILDNLDEIGSPSDGSTPERPFARKSSLSFATLPAREPLKTRTSYVDLAKMSTAGRPSYFGRQTGGHRIPQAAAEDSSGSRVLEIEPEKEPSEEADPDEATRMHIKKSTQSLHDRISMLGKLQPSRPRKSIPSASGLVAGQVSYPDLPASKAESKSDASNERAHEAPAPEPMSVDDDWIRPLSSPQKPELFKSKGTTVKEKLAEIEKPRAINKIDTWQTEPAYPKSSTSIFSSPRPHGHQPSISLSHTAADASTTPTGSPRRFDGHISASKLKLHSIMKSAKGLFSSTGSTLRIEHSPEQARIQPSADPSTKLAKHLSQPVPIISPQRPEGRRTRSSTEKEEKRRQHQREEQERGDQEEEEEEEEEEERTERAREQEKQRALKLKAAQENSSVEPEERSGSAAHKAPHSQRQQSREPELAQESNSRFAIPQPKQNDRRPLKPTREPMKRPTPQPMSIRVGSTMSRQQIPVPSSSSTQELVASSAPTSKPTLKKKGSNTSLHTASSASSFKSSISSQTQAQRKAQVASDRKKEQEREARRKEEQKRELERKRASQQQQQEEARRQEMRSRVEAERERQAERDLQAERERRDRSAQEDPNKAARMEAIKKRQAENARKHGRQGSQQILSEGQSYSTSSHILSLLSEVIWALPALLLAWVALFSHSVAAASTHQRPNPAKPPKRANDEANHRLAPSKPSNVQSTGEFKRRKTEDEYNPLPPVRTMAQPIRQSNIRKPSTLGRGQSSIAPQSTSSSYRNAQPQRPAHPIVTYTNGKIPFAEPNHAPPPPSTHKAAPNSAQRPQAKPSPKYPSGENIHLPGINTDSEDDDDSDSEMFPVPKWAQAKELEVFFGSRMADKKVKKYRDRTSSANWSGPDGLTQEEIRKDVAERQRLRLNGGWSFNS
ncbi:hypothetical protein PDIDSM_8382 [Penicillium digitatum]|nr:hypothetical protein PDIDSM_8382 [Penicillium digitatum]